ncbi:MAG: UDP-N-acetylmuramate--L-alanine ligase [Anaerolineaceae bacterium 4572_32.2]|nr:MAG: UDP-N-acetylmuramate--L-alanine ligase [Anaerolineaceae bacterium 4572_32.2]
MTTFSGKHIHLIGIGGAGLSAIARVLMEQGAEVSGSDLTLSPVAESLARDGVRVFDGHRAENVNGADLVVVSSAVPASNVEVRAAQAAGIPVLKRPQVLGRMMNGRLGVTVAGTKGKTTTTAMIASILLKAERDPTFIVGGVLAGLETNAHAGKEPLFVIEADEYDRTFLGLKPTVAVVTNVEHDHPDCYPTFDDFQAAFAEFVALVPRDGLLVACWDDPAARALGERRREAGGAVAFFGLEEGAEWRAEDVRPNFAGGVDFLITRGGEVLGLVRLRLPGTHNASNAAAAIAVADFLNVPLRVARSALTEFRGVKRRFEIKGESGGVTVVDDYAHHPTAIRVTLQAARERFTHRSLWAVWQPHTYSRTRALLKDFARAFDLADHVILLPIYAARETDALNTSSRDVAAEMQHPDVRCAGSLDEALVWLGTEVRPGNVVLTLGAGDGNRVGEWLLEVLDNDQDQ